MERSYRDLPTPEGFFADQNYWAPECYQIHDAFYLVTTFGSSEGKKGIYVLKSDKPEGPFAPYSGRLTRKNGRPLTERYTGRMGRLT